MPKKEKYDIGYCSGVVEHIYHGKSSTRGYVYREKLLREHNYNPDTDIRISENGLYEILNKEMKPSILEYFTNRNLATTKS
jgi:hypothetical protein